MARFFLDRPVFAWVIAIGMMLAGGLAIYNCPSLSIPTSLRHRSPSDASTPAHPQRRWKTAWSRSSNSR